MRRIGVRDLKARASDILRSVREEGQSYEVTYHGRAIARVVPVIEPVARDAPETFLAVWQQLGDAVSAAWPAGVSPVDAVRDNRRDL